MVAFSVVVVAIIHALSSVSSLIIGIKHQHRGIGIGVQRLYSLSTPSQLHEQHYDDDGLSLSSSVTTNDGKNGIYTATTQDENIELHQQQQHRRTALSIPIDELSVILGGTGRARLAWDCYVNGADPQYLFGALSSSGSGDNSSENSEYDEYKDVEYVKRQVIPTPRQTQPLGSMALNNLSTLHSHCGGTNNSIENGLATLIHISSSMDGTTKLLLRLVDGLEVETVLIPFYSNTNQFGRTTVCVSSQVGCLQGCTFCATGKMGKLRSLTSDEILVQLFYAKKIVRLSTTASTTTDDGVSSSSCNILGTSIQPLPKISNVVFMGMGEPSDNAIAVRTAIDIMTRNDLFQLSASRVTVSTVAPTPQSFDEFVTSKCVLAWSVHAANDTLRKRLVPTTKHSMNELRAGLIHTLQRRAYRTVMIEVTLIHNINDSLIEANEMAEFLLHITNSVSGSKLACNLIPYNDIGSLISGYTKPPMERIIAFQKRLQEYGIQAHVRGTRGDDEMAACGQLVTNHRAKRKRENTMK
jgi:23S rRNA (adenine2503-C2)-methyltransferase